MGKDARLLSPRRGVCKGICSRNGEDDVVVRSFA
jgi:hypothetical protein